MVVTLRIDQDLVNADWIKTLGHGQRAAEPATRAELERLFDPALWVDLRRMMLGVVTPLFTEAFLVGVALAAKTKPRARTRARTRIGVREWQDAALTFMAGAKHGDGSHDESDHGNWARGGGGWQGGIIGLQENHPREATIAAIKSVIAGWDSETQAALTMIHVRYPTLDEERSGTLASTRSREVPIDVNDPAWETGTGKTFVTNSIEITPGIVYGTIKVPPGPGYLAKQGERMTLPFILNHEMMHVFVNTRFGIDKLQQGKYLESRGMTPKALEEMSLISRYARTSSFPEKIAEAAALYMTYGRVPGPHTANLLRNIGIITDERELEFKRAARASANAQEAA